MATEKRLIDAGDLWSDVMMLPHNGDMISSEEVEQAIKEAPTVDAVEVVRCVNCQSHEPCEVRNRVWCRTMGRYMKEDGFCSEGDQIPDG